VTSQILSLTRTADVIRLVIGGSESGK
jgi:hypothetical protein